MSPAVPPRISIVIPTFNRSGMLRRAIDSALAQTTPCEVVVCDHGSSDDTPDVARSYGDRIIYVRRPKDHGVHFAWLDGVMAASGEFIHINFDDDSIAPDFVEKCAGLLADDVAFVLTKALVVEEGSGKVTDCLFGGMGRTGTHAVGRFMAFQIKSLVSPGAMLLRKTDILRAIFMGKLPFAKEEYRGVGPDWLMSALATLDRPKFGFVDEPLAIFSAHQGSITTSALSDRAKKKALRRAYQTARFYYVMERLNRNFAFRMAFAGSFLAYQNAGRIRYGVGRFFRDRFGVG
jgi:glycosyltransferase involved in cell wall biosynthesis